MGAPVHRLPAGTSSLGIDSCLAHKSCDLRIQGGLDVVLDCRGSINTEFGEVLNRSVTALNLVKQS